MQQLRCYGDDRNNGFCVHCGGPSETIDHVPSKVLLDEPYPENLMAAPACRECNNGLSLDEEYLACLLECVIAGDIAPEKLHRAKIGRILRANSSLLTRLQRARTDGAEGPVWAAENDRVSRVILKLARCHAAFELNEPQLHEPSRLGFKPLSLMTEKSAPHSKAMTTRSMSGRKSGAVRCRGCLWRAPTLSPRDGWPCKKETIASIPAKPMG